MDATCCWFAMRATYKRELVAKEYLTGKGFEVFVPLKKVIKVVRGIKKKVTEPAIKGLIFVKGESEALKQAKFGVEYLQYITRKDGERNVPIIVPERQMEQFIAVVQDDAVDKTFYTPDEVNITSGTKVRVHGGPFDGFEGVLVRVQGKRNKQFFINIDGLVTVNTVVKNVELLEVME